MVQGRHSEYTDNLAQIVCDVIASGEPLSVAAEIIGYSPGTIYEWLGKYKDFSDKYALARETQADTLADQIVKLADNEQIAPDARRIRVEARKWVAAKLKPKRYGDKVTLAGDAENPLTMLALRLDSAVQRRTMIDVTPDDASDLL